MIIPTAHVFLHFSELHFGFPSEKNIFGDLTLEKSCQLATNRFEKKIIQSNQHFFNGFIKTKNKIGALFLCL